MTITQTRALSPGLVTLAIASVNIVAFVTMVGSGVSLFEPLPVELIRWGALYGPLTIDHQWWRLGSSMFLHAGIFHLALNTLCLLSLGPVAEVRFGATPFLAGYLLAGLGGGIVSLLVHPSTVGVGASGAIFGTASWLLVCGTAHEGVDESDAPEIINFRLASFLALNLFFGLTQPNIDNAAHIGGLAAGALLGLFSRLGTRQRAVWIGQLGLVALGATVVASMIALKSYRGVTPQAYAEAQQEIADAQYQEDLTERSHVAAQARTADLAVRLTRAKADVRDHPDSASAYVELGAAYALSDSIDAADRTLRMGNARVPSNPNLLTALGTLQLNRRRFADAVGAYEEALALNPTSAEARYNLAFAYQGLAMAATEAGDRLTATHAWQRILQLRADPSLDAAARLGLAALTGEASSQAGSR